MSYTVAWTPSAERDLADAWLASTNRTGVASAAHQIEQQLRLDPLHTGEARKSDVTRVVIWPPLSILFDVVEDDKRVLIRAVRLFS